MSQDSLSPLESALSNCEDDGSAGGGARVPVRGLRSHNIVVDGKRTSIRLDPISLEALYEIATRERTSVNELCTMIMARNQGNDFTFTAAIRIFLLSYYRAASTEEGHQLAGHGQARPLYGTPFEEPASLKATPPRPRGNRGRPPQAAKPGQSLDNRSSIRLSEAAGRDLPVN